MRLVSRIIQLVSVAVFTGFCLSLVVILGVYGYYYPSLPSIDVLKDVRLQTPLRIYSKDHELIAEFGEQRRSPAPFSDIPKPLIQAFLAAEDARFFEHPGVDYRGLIRAALNQIRTGEKQQGGSTITMQVARNFFLSREKTYERKIKEILLALKIEHSLSKEQIFELYLNKIYLGNRAYGVKAAAAVYYGLELDELSIAQAAMIASLPKAPSQKNPIADPKLAQFRRNYILGRMHQLGFIDQTTYEMAKSAKVNAYFHAPAVTVDAPHIAEMARLQMADFFGDSTYTGGYKVITTLDAASQAIAIKAYRKALRDYDKRHGYRGPEATLSLPDPPIDPNYLEKTISNYPDIGELSAGIVIQLGQREAQVYLGKDQVITLTWTGMRWARPYIDENRLGAAPQNANDILSVGDIIRLHQVAVIDAKTGEKTTHWELQQMPKVTGSLVVLNPQDGAILSLIGSYDFYINKFNRASQSRRQLGSGFKPILYASALESGFTPATTVLDAPIVFKNASMRDGFWRPANYSTQFFGPTRLRVGLYKSRNVVSVRMIDSIGVKPVREMARRFGFTEQELPNNLTLSLGSGSASPLRVASAYAVFANGGFRITPYLIDRVYDHKNRLILQANPQVACYRCALAPPVTTTAPSHDQPLLSLNTYQKFQVNQETHLPKPLQLAPRILSPQVHYQMVSMLGDVIKKGTARRALQLKRTDLAGKTGTTNEQRDAWFSGFNRDLVATAWVGFDDFTPLGHKETGSRVALPIWINYMKQALDGKPERAFLQPNGMLTTRINPETGHVLAAQQTGGIFETFRKEYAPKTNPGNRATTTIADKHNKGETSAWEEELF